MIGPADWTLLPLGDVARIYSGGTPSRSVSAYWGGGIPWASTAEVDDSSISSTKETISELGLANSAAKVAPAGTLLMAMYGQGKTRGKTSILAIDAAMNQACAAIEPGKRVHPHYLLAYLRHNYDEIRALSNSGGQENLSGEIVKKIPVLFPGLDEQYAVASAAEHVAAHIATLERLIAKKQAIKQSMMQQLLTGRTRLPGYTGKWDSTKLGAVASMSSGGTPPSGVAAYYGGGIPWVSISDMTSGGKYISRTENTLTEEGLGASAARLYEPHAVLYAMYASLGECSLAVGRVSSSQAILGIKAGRDLDREFLYYWLQYLKPQVKLSGQQGTQSNLNAGMVRGLDLQLPKIDEQIAIRTALSDSDAEISASERRLTKARAIKAGMMQQLLTGRTRLPVEVSV